MGVGVGEGVGLGVLVGSGVGLGVGVGPVIGGTTGGSEAKVAVIVQSSYTLLKVYEFNMPTEFPFTETPEIW